MASHAGSSSAPPENPHIEEEGEEELIYGGESGWVEARILRSLAFSILINYFTAAFPSLSHTLQTTVYRMLSEILAKLYPRPTMPEKPHIKKEKEKENLIYVRVSGWVKARTSCDHLASLSSNLTHIPTPDTPCHICEHPHENFLCLCCKEVLCGRYVNKHMLNHYDNTNHCLVLGYSDLSVWCYSCDDYVNAQVIQQLRPVYELAYILKFGQPHPSTMKESTITSTSSSLRRELLLGAPSSSIPGEFHNMNLDELFSSGFASCKRNESILEVLYARTSSLQKLYQDAKASIAPLERRLKETEKSLSSAHASSESEKSKVKNELKTLLAKVASSETKVATLDGEIISLKKQLNESSIRESVLELKNELSTEIIHDLTAQAQAHEHTIAELKQKISSLEVSNTPTTQAVEVAHLRAGNDELQRSQAALTLGATWFGWTQSRLPADQRELVDLESFAALPGLPKNSFDSSSSVPLHRKS